MTSGYSRTPLAKKLSLKNGMRVWWDGMPDSVSGEIFAGLKAQGASMELLGTPVPPIGAAHIFVTERVELERKLRMLLPLIERDGFIWVSWPKKAARMPTDVSEDIIREVALPMDLVDVKVCAVDAIWSGLKLVIRKELR